ncbi:MAG: hypothetical protein JWN70_2531, partial [Planctomycetaceae bacterium]|nr:hypothetical protein [Planctomycetaceae bacterium]
MPPMNRWIEQFQRRVLLGEFLHRAADALAIFLFVFGTIVLTVRLAVPQLWPHVLWLAAGAVPVAAVAWWLACQRQQSRRETIAMLDQKLAAGGLLMTLAERPDEEWSTHLPTIQTLWQKALPRLFPKRFTSYLAMPLLFAVAACFVPLREAKSTPIVPLAVAKNATEQLEELKESLDQAEILKEEEKKEFEEEVAKLQEETQDTPLTHENWETVDALTERLQLRVDDAAALNSKFQEAVAQLAKAAGGDGPQLSPEAQEQLERDVAEAIEQLSKKGATSEKISPGKPGAGNKSMADRLQKLMKDGKARLPTDPKERQELLDQLKEELEKEKKKLSELRKKCKACSKCNGMGDGECEGLSDRPGAKKDGKPGRGGVTRGRGDADMSYGDEASENGVKFKETILPPGFADNPKDEVVGTQLISPNEDPAAVAAKGAQRVIDPSSGNATWNRKLSPK